MILTVALNPAVDRTCRLKHMAAGEVNRLDSAKSVAGGKAVNVAKVLRTFCIPVEVVGFLGGTGGTFIADSLEEMGIGCHFTKISGETRTNTNVVEDDGTVTEILEPGPVISDDELRKFIKQFTGCVEYCEMAVLSGSLPRGVPDDIYSVLIKICRMSGCRAVLDTSGEALRLGIEAGPYLVKPNKRELEYLAGRTLSGEDEIALQARRILDAGAENVAVSLGSRGLLGCDGQGVVFKKAVKVKAVNTVGCGDAAVASLCMSALAGDGMETALSKAVALAAANALTEENGSVSVEKYLKLLESQH